MQKSSFFESTKILEEMKYYGIGSRYVQHYDLESKKPLTEEEAKRRPKYDMFDLFVDPIVDKIHPRMKALFGWSPISEPWLANVFSGSQFVMSEYFGKEITLPHPEILVSMKMNSVLNRNKADKRIKDMADIYALMWYSDVKFSDMKRTVHRICGLEKVASTVSKFDDDDYAAVSQVLEISKDEVSEAILEMARE